VVVFLLKPLVELSPGAYAPGEPNASLTCCTPSASDQAGPELLEPW